MQPTASCQASTADQSRASIRLLGRRVAFHDSRLGLKAPCAFCNAEASCMCKGDIVGLSLGMSLLRFAQDHFENSRINASVP